MRPAPFSYLLTTGAATLLAPIMIFRDLDVPILWSTAIGVAAWSWVLLLLWSSAFPDGRVGKPDPKWKQRGSGRTARRARNRRI